MSKITKNHYKNFVANNELEQLIEELLQHLNRYLSNKKDSQLQRAYDGIIILSGRFRSIVHEEKLGLITAEQATVNKSNLGHSLLSIINDLPAYYFNFLNGEQKESFAASTDLRQQVEKVHQDSRFEYDAFLSFSSKDLEEAKQVCEELRGYGLHVFLSDEALKANTGGSFFEKIEYALNNSRHFILLSSPNSMGSEWVKTEYETFYNEYHIKSKSERRFIILKGKQFNIAGVPALLKRLQFAATPKDILSTLVEDQAFQSKKVERERQAAAKGLEEQALAEKRKREQLLLEQKAGEKKLNKEAQQRRIAEQERLQKLALAERQKKEKQEARQAARQAFFQNHGKNIGLGGLGLFLLILGFMFIPSMCNNTAPSIGVGINTLPPVIAALEKNMISIPSGTFTMGCTSEQSDCGSDEKPTQEVILSSFKMNKYEVTQEEWRAVMGSDPEELNFKGCDKCPVERVSWNEIQEFLKKLNKMTDGNYRLPTEAEWEYAARGNERHKYAGSNNIGEVAWYGENANSKTHQVGGKKKNGFGLYDMSGNVYEWCSDWYGEYSSSQQRNPNGASRGSYRVNRGGSWYHDAQYCRVAYRSGISPSLRYSIIGFRLAHR